MTDLEIASGADIRPITEIAAKYDIAGSDLELCGPYKAKLTESAIAQFGTRGMGKLILVTSINPTPAGEGKTTTTIALGDALNALGRPSAIALREPSLGPVFGMKGGAAGGGLSQVIPMEDINLHFTGDLHAVAAANNLLCAMTDNSIYQGNPLDIDPEADVFPRAIDMNDRALRSVRTGEGGASRPASFQITAASEIMSVLCLAADIPDLKRRLARVVAARTRDGSPVTAADLHADGAMAVLLRDAFRPNLVQTIGGSLCFMHGGPFANISFGCNSVRATRMAMACSEYAVTEAGFGADLGAEKFFHIACGESGLRPSAAVVVVSVRALLHNGGSEALDGGCAHLRRHLANIKRFGITPIVAINRFASDTPEELTYIKSFCASEGVFCGVSEAYSKGAAGILGIARQVAFVCDTDGDGFRPFVPDGTPALERINMIAKELYGAGSVELSPEARRQLDSITASGDGRLPVCIAKTQYSFSDDPALLGTPSGFALHISAFRLCAGAGFIIAYAGKVLTMPGLPKKPAAEGISLCDDGSVVGLF